MFGSSVQGSCTETSDGDFDGEVRYGWPAPFWNIPTYHKHIHFQETSHRDVREKRSRKIYNAIQQHSPHPRYSPHPRPHPPTHHPLAPRQSEPVPHRPPIWNLPRAPGMPSWGINILLRRLHAVSRSAKWAEWAEWAGLPEPTCLAKLASFLRCDLTLCRGVRVAGGSCGVSWWRVALWVVDGQGAG